MKYSLLILYAMAMLCIGKANAQAIETFESQTPTLHSFVSNSTGFRLNTIVPNTGSRFYVTGISGLGYNGSNRFIHADDSYGQINSISINSGYFSVNGFFMYITGDAGQNPGVTSNGGTPVVTFRGKQLGNTVFTIIKNSGFETTLNLPGNGFGYVNFSLEGGVDNSNTPIDTLEIELSENLDYFAIDNFDWEHAILPVDLTSFTAKKQGDAAILSWTTASEHNNDRFVIERSADGKLFEAAGEVKGSGNSSMALSYTYTDHDMARFAAGLQPGTVYYRLRQIDVDGKEHVYGIQGVKAGAATMAVLDISPNPFTDEVGLRISGAAGSHIAVSVTDLAGRAVMPELQAAVSATNGQVQLSGLDVLQKGIYFIHISSSGETITRRIIKTR
jgi:hypothetical protein